MSFLFRTRHHNDSNKTEATPPSAGLFDCKSLPRNLEEIGLKSSRGLLMVFVPPEVEFRQVSNHWQSFSNPALKILSISSSGTLCNQGRSSMYCPADGIHGSWLCLPENLVAQTQIGKLSTAANAERNNIVASLSHLQELASGMDAMEGAITQLKQLQQLTTQTR